MPFFDLQYFATAVANPAVLLAITAWTLVWKGIATWRAARNNQLYWFVALLLLNTVGILDIIYIKFFQREIADKREWPAGLGKFFQGKRPPRK